jgi:hypothetical protein
MFKPKVSDSTYYEAELDDKLRDHQQTSKKIVSIAIEGEESNRRLVDAANTMLKAAKKRDTLADLIHAMKGGRSR